jgi:hypothetical protein
MDTYGTVAYYVDGAELLFCVNCWLNACYDGEEGEKPWKLNQEDMDKMFGDDIQNCAECNCGFEQWFLNV